MRPTTTSPAQLGFDSLLLDADAENDRRAYFKVTRHLPETWADALPFYRNLLDLHHAAMLKADENEVIRLRGDAHDLAWKLNGGSSHGICAADGYGSRLEAETAAAAGDVPKWGQTGTFTLDHAGMSTRIEIHGMFGLTSTFAFWPGFSAHVVNRRKPFLSETGYRSFLGCGYSALIPDFMPDQFVAAMISDFVDNQIGGKLLKVKPVAVPAIG